MTTKLQEIWHHVNISESKFPKCGVKCMGITQYQGGLLVFDTATWPCDLLPGHGDVHKAVGEDKDGIYMEVHWSANVVKGTTAFHAVVDFGN